MRSIKRAGIVVTVLLLPVGYLAAHETLLIILPPILYIAGAVSVITICLGAIGAWAVGFAMVRTRVAELGSLRVIAAANAQIALAEAQQKQVMVITAPRDHQLVVRDGDEGSYYRQLHLAPQSHVNGIASPVTPEQIAVYRDYHGRGGNSGPEPLMLAAPEEKQDIDSILSQYGPDWIQSVVLPAPHVHYCGATRSGKTTLANHHIEWIAKREPDAEFYLLNPKDTAARKPFIINPDYKDIDEALDGLAHFNRLMIKRKNDPSLSKDAHKIVFIIDEWDWIYDQYGNEAKRLLMPLVKVGAELKVQVILIGQSPLTGDTGLSQSFYHNMVRVAIWQEGARLLNNYPLDKVYKAPLMGEYETLKTISQAYELRTGQQLRYCTVVPMASNPTVEVIPYLSDPQPIKQNEAAKYPTPSPEEKKILRTWWGIKDAKDYSGTKLHALIRPDLTSRPSAKMLADYREVIEKYGYKAGF